MSLSIAQASIDDLEALVPLFDGYRQFYGQPSDATLARQFLRDRFNHGDSVIFVAKIDSGKAAGFTQLFPTYSSVAANRIHILNDLFVISDFRNQGCGTLLLKASVEYAKKIGSTRLVLSTAKNNFTAQKLYTSQNWRQDSQFLDFKFDL